MLFTVVFKDSATQEQIDQCVKQIKDEGGQVTARYSEIKGFVAKLTESQLQNLQGNDIVEYIEPNKEPSGPS